jgi:lipopolysaccharide transport system permease protein
LLRDLLAYRTFIVNMVMKDLKLRYQASILGFLWSMVNPLLMLVIYTVVFSRVMRVTTESNYTFFLVSGLMPWMFFSGALVASTNSVIGNAGLVRKVRFPLDTLPVATVLFNFAQFLLALLVVVPGLVLITGARLSAEAWFAIPLLLLHVAFTTGVAFVLAALTTVFRDVTHLTDVLLMVLFWNTPIVYPAEMAPPALQAWFRVSPIAGFTEAYQTLLVKHRLPDGGTLVMLVAWTVVALAVGRLTFRRYSGTFAEAV